MLRAHREGGGVPSGGAPFKTPPTARVAGLVAAALLIAASFALVPRPGSRESEGGDREPATAPVSDGVRAGIARTLGAEETASRAPWICKIVATGPHDGLSLRARVTRVLHGDGSLAGREVLVAPRASARDGNLGGGSERSFLGVERIGSIAAEGDGAGEAWLMALRAAAPAAEADGTPRLVPAIDEFLDATRAGLGDGADIAEAGSLGPLLGELVAAAEHPSGDVRASALRALRDWDARDPSRAAEPSPVLWRIKRVARCLLAATRDADPRVRWAAAWTLAPEAGAEGELRLKRLLFDRDRLVRQPAAILLGQRGHRELADTAESIADYELDGSWNGVLAPSMGAWAYSDEPRTLLLLREHEQAVVRAGAAWALGGRAPTPLATAALVDALADADVQVRRGAVWSLGALGVASAASSLAAIVETETEDARVRAMAARSLALLGDERGVDGLGALAASADLPVACQAVEALADLPAATAHAPLLAAAADPRAAVRGVALVGLARIALDVTPEERDAIHRLVSAGLGDASAWVNAAASAALAEWTAAAAARRAR